MQAVSDQPYYYEGLNQDNLAFNNAQFDRPNGEMKKYKGKPKGSVDWTSSGAVTDIIDQGHCNASWAFMATEVISSASQIQGGKLEQLSAQQLIDCAQDYGAQKCGGGSIFSGF